MDGPVENSPYKFLRFVPKVLDSGSTKWFSEGVQSKGFLAYTPTFTAARLNELATLAGRS